MLRSYGHLSFKIMAAGKVCNSVADSKDTMADKKDMGSIGEVWPPTP
jgi:hypothetical protein